MMHDDDYLLSLSIITVTSSGNIKINTNNLETSPSNSDAILTIRRSLDLDYQKSLETFTINELRFGRENT